MLMARIMKLHRYIDHDWQMTPIDFQVTRVNDTVTVPPLLSSHGAGLLSTWCEELGQQLLVRHEKSSPADKGRPGDMHPHLQKPMGGMGACLETCTHTSSNQWGEWAHAWRHTPTPPETNGGNGRMPGDIHPHLQKPMGGMGACLETCTHTSRNQWGEWAHAWRHTPTPPETNGGNGRMVTWRHTPTPPETDGGEWAHAWRHTPTPPETNGGNGRMTYTHTSRNQWGEWAHAWRHTPTPPETNGGNGRMTYTHISRNQWGEWAHAWRHTPTSPETNGGNGRMTYTHTSRNQWGNRHMPGDIHPHLQKPMGGMGAWLPGDMHPHLQKPMGGMGTCLETYTHTSRNQWGEWAHAWRHTPTPPETNGGNGRMVTWRHAPTPPETNGGNGRMTYTHTSRNQWGEWAHAWRHTPTPPETNGGNGRMTYTHTSRNQWGNRHMPGDIHPHLQKPMGEWAHVWRHAPTPPETNGGNGHMVTWRHTPTPPETNGGIDTWLEWTHDIHPHLQKPMGGNGHICNISSVAKQAEIHLSLALEKWGLMQSSMLDNQGPHVLPSAHTLSIKDHTLSIKDHTLCLN
ncbi:hypothetical protein DPMN_024717 [Dreissena polymorpha]|uniref:Uncharacterized protein n=1 Tax=Dreissena polymorpha TaxID=45954 RepID=A0A9D4RCL1_DREPO|nr:hypothetical protein DPMN_024717 [Dreissena polymorpha]